MFVLSTEAAVPREVDFLCPRCEATRVRLSESCAPGAIGTVLVALPDMSRTQDVRGLSAALPQNVHTLATGGSLQIHCNRWWNR